MSMLSSSSSFVAPINSPCYTLADGTCTGISISQFDLRYGGRGSPDESTTRGESPRVVLSSGGPRQQQYLVHTISSAEDEVVLRWDHHNLFELRDVSSVGAHKSEDPGRMIPLDVDDFPFGAGGATPSPPRLVHCDLLRRTDVRKLPTRVLAVFEHLNRHTSSVEVFFNLFALDGRRVEHRLLWTSSTSDVGPPPREKIISRMISGDAFVWRRGGRFREEDHDLSPTGTVSGFSDPPQRSAPQHVVCSAPGAHRICVLLTILEQEELNEILVPNKFLFFVDEVSLRSCGGLAVADLTATPGGYLAGNSIMTVGALAGHGGPHAGGDDLLLFVERSGTGAGAEDRRIAVRAAEVVFGEENDKNNIQQAFLEVVAADVLTDKAICRGYRTMGGEDMVCGGISRGGGWADGSQISREGFWVSSWGIGHISVFREECNARIDVDVLKEFGGLDGAAVRSCDASRILFRRRKLSQGTISAFVSELFVLSGDVDPFVDEHEQKTNNDFPARLEEDATPAEQAAEENADSTTRPPSANTLLVDHSPADAIVRLVSSTPIPPASVLGKCLRPKAAAVSSSPGKNPRGKTRPKAAPKSKTSIAQQLGYSTRTSTITRHSAAAPASSFATTSGFATTFNRKVKGSGYGPPQAKKSLYLNRKHEMARMLAENRLPPATGENTRGGSSRASFNNWRDDRIMAQFSVGAPVTDLVVADPDGASPLLCVATSDKTIAVVERWRGMPSKNPPAPRGFVADTKTMRVSVAGSHGTVAGGAHLLLTTATASAGGFVELFALYSSAASVCGKNFGKPLLRLEQLSGSSAGGANSSDGTTEQALVCRDAAFVARDGAIVALTERTDRLAVFRYDLAEKIAGDDVSVLLKLGKARCAGML